ncbi:MAG TPA: hypothetical protein VN628_18550, partial [Vicinamibacterales bacterium]|nr:hypothetical protein [Vicinamibacterales bacterium]
SNLRSLLIPTSANVLVTLLSLFFVFEIGAVLAQNEWTALAGALVYATLIGSSLYVRHLVPYDWALCVGLGALWLAVARPKTRGLAVWTGALTGAMLTVYTGYYPFCGVVGLAVLWDAWDTRERGDAIRFAVVFALSAAAVIAAVELLFRAGGLSYIGSLRGVRRDISFTSYGDGFLFLPEYLLDVERLSGVALILGAVVYLRHMVLRIARGILRPIDRVMLPMLVACAAQSASSVYLHAIPLFGRLIHPWMPFLAWMFADALTHAEYTAARRSAYTGMIAAVAISIGANAWTYWPLKYPPDVLYALGIDTTKVPREQQLCELYPGTEYASPGPIDRATNAPYTNDSSWVLVNFCQALPEVPRPRLVAHVPPSARRVFDGPHWMSFPAYAYEGLIEEDREAMARERYRLQVFTLSR